MTGTPCHANDRTDTSTADNLPAFPGAVYVTCSRSLEASLLMAEKYMIPLKFLKLLGTLKL